MYFQQPANTSYREPEVRSTGRALYSTAIIPTIGHVLDNQSADASGDDPYTMAVPFMCTLYNTILYNLYNSINRCLNC